MRPRSNRGLLAGVALAVLAAPIALAAGNPQSLLPPETQDPAPSPAPAPAPAPAPSPSAAPSPTASPAVQENEGTGAGQSDSADESSGSGRGRLPTLEELEALDTDELDELLGLRPSFDIPPAQRRETSRVGILAEGEGGLPAASLANQPESLVRAAISGTQGRLVSRWGHITLRRALASRLAPPANMSGAEFAGLRAQLLNRMGEFGAARALAQDVDIDAWNARLANAAVDAYIATGDIVGACPLAVLRGDYREDAQWRMVRSICDAYAGEASRARSDLLRMRDSSGQGDFDLIDVLLAQRFAGAAGLGNSAVTIEWDEVEELTPWRYGLANALGISLPERLVDDAGPYYQRAAASLPSLPLALRLDGARRAAREGIFSSSALIDLYSQAYATSGNEGAIGTDAAQLRAAYVDPDPAARLAAIRSLWGDGAAIPHDRQVLTAYAAARIPATDQFVGDAAPLIASMFTAGLDLDAARWRDVVDEGDAGWAMLAVGLPEWDEVSRNEIDDFRDNDGSAGQARTGLLVAGLAGLGRISSGTRNSWDRELDLGLSRETRWSAMIDRAAEVENAALVAFLMGLGIQGDDWNRMTPRHLYHIVSALHRSGMEAEARMIAAEAIARG
ncbi:hypothetical protein [Alteriqipengyuania lutimaris]|uniref:Antifreeze protein n=1 Tax=Alteriqipengyuania lutimaris TaxID=1538146 RepID=A0A395LRU2_9SPHN|nr:hypothetical protein [Alteriqipengyuania lutimaris]MBB3032683.1 hypothetical protein [Alteriqipengyuania lutimaris]RDS78204.1 hypothetical protein DL238_11720 [Alteriqipengyuania lutimaris]